MLQKVTILLYVTKCNTFIFILTFLHTQIIRQTLHAFQALLHIIWLYQLTATHYMKSLKPCLRIIWDYQLTATHYMKSFKPCYTLYEIISTYCYTLYDYMKSFKPCLRIIWLYEIIWNLRKHSIILHLTLYQSILHNLLNIKILYMYPYRKFYIV